MRQVVSHPELDSGSLFILKTGFTIQAFRNDIIKNKHRKDKILKQVQDDYNCKYKSPRTPPATQSFAATGLFLRGDEKAKDRSLTFVRDDRVKAARPEERFRASAGIEGTDPKLKEFVVSDGSE